MCDQCPGKEYVLMSKVFFTDLRASSKENLLDKVDKLFEAAGFSEIIEPKDLVALKIHFGEKGNTGYIRPQFVRRIVDKVKGCQGKPFLTDANTLYVGSRSNAVDHLQTAVENGFDYAVVNCPLVIADGLTGKEYINVHIEGGKHLQEVKIGSAAYHSDAIIAVTHFKGHELTGFGGALKNLGMGLGSRSGKQIMHSDVLPSVTEDKCIACGRCSEWCPAGAIEVEESAVAVIDKDKCIGCGECTVTCTEGAIKVSWKTTPDIIQEKIAEFTAGVLKNKKGKAGYITFLMNVTPECDCVSFSDVPLVHDIGILASKDPVAIDQACIDLVNKARVLHSSRIGGTPDVEDKFRAVHKHVDWSVQLAHGEKLGLGSRDYGLIQLSNS